MITRVFSGAEFRWWEGYPNTDDACVLIVPGRYWFERTDEISAAIARYPSVLAIRTGDEEDLFDIARVQHPNIRWWVQTPTAERDYGDARFVGVGWTPHFDDLQAYPPLKDVDVALAGQNTHPRREAAFAAAARCPNVELHPSEGFTQGLPPAAYRDLMLRTKVAPCPSGAVSPDSFRVWEALEAHAVPVVDDLSPVNAEAGFWTRVLPDAPFPVLVTWPKLPAIAAQILSDWPHTGNAVTAWWMRYKQDLCHAVTDPGPITVVVPVSPIPSHPDTGILDETIGSIRHHLPRAPIIVTFDGVRPEHVDRAADYDEHIYRALWRLDHVHGNVRPVLFDGHKHQTGMLRAVLPEIRTPLLMYVEHDAPLVVDEPIDFDLIADFVTSGQSDLVRLHHEGVIPAEHRHMMHGFETKAFLRTSQWSQRPHVTSTAFYRRIVDTCFSDGAKAFIEDRMHGVVDEAVKRDGLAGWRQYRLHIYAGADGNMKRSYHLDGRAGAEKYDDGQVF